MHCTKSNGLDGEMVIKPLHGSPPTVFRSLVGFVSFDTDHFSIISVVPCFAPLGP